MFAAMILFLHLALLAMTALLVGCGGSTSLRDASVDAAPSSDAGAGPDTRLVGAEEDSAYALPAEIDSLFVEAGWLLDDLVVPVDSLGSPAAFDTDLPDLSDSLAAATEAQLPSMDEIFDYDVVVNRRVLAWIDLYQGRARRTFERSLKRSGLYLAMARRIFAEEGVPQDLAFLAHVESGFRYNALSPKRALGLWQFMRGTARIYGLRCDSYVDERLDPEKSTRACAQHLRDLYERFGDWHLSLAAYNAGAGKVSRAVRKTGSHDFWQIARTRYLRNETRNFVPAILAATILAKSPGAYGLTEETYDPLEYDTIEVASPTDLRVIAGAIGVRLAEMKELNPGLLVLQTPLNAPGYDVRVPKGTGLQAAAELAKIPPEKRLVFHRHKVRSGESLGLLARRYGTTVRAIQDANHMGNRTMIRISQTLRVPSRHGGLAEIDREGAIQHVVRRGEYLARIASQYGVKVRKLQEANGIVDASRIYAGQILIIPPTEHATAVTTQAARKPADHEATGMGASAAAALTPDSGYPSDDAGSWPDIVRAHNTSDSLGRVPTTAHIVAQAREAIEREREQGRLTDASAPRVHVVRRGDTLSEIAANCGARLSDVRRWNNMGRRSLIRPGQEICVSDPVLDATSEGDARLHVVSSGESLWKIAKHYSVRVADLAGWNGLSRSTTIYPGQRLLVY